MSVDTLDISDEGFSLLLRVLARQLQHVPLAMMPSCDVAVVAFQTRRTSFLMPYK